jgi:hypothetical protein
MQTYLVFEVFLELFPRLRAGKMGLSALSA